MTDKLNLTKNEPSAQELSNSMRCMGYSLELKNDSYIQLLPIDEARMAYLEYHRKSVFRG